MNAVTDDVVEVGRNITDEGDITRKRLATLQDPQLIARWAELRVRLAYKRDPDYAALKAEYDALVAEYRRRIEPVAS